MLYISDRRSLCVLDGNLNDFELGKGKLENVQRVVQLLRRKKQLPV